MTNYHDDHRGSVVTGGDVEGVVILVAAVLIVLMMLVMVMLSATYVWSTLNNRQMEFTTSLTRAGGVR